MTKKGKFIVIDGTDGSGKATQVKLLVKRLRQNGYRVKTIDFPRYYDNFFGKFIGECLANGHGNFVELDPYIASVLYAADRYESAKQLNKWLDEGSLVIADRYASSNQIHQGGKIGNAAARKKFLAWLEKMEFEVFKIPRPNLIIYLEVPIEITQGLLSGKRAARKKRYLNGKKDIVESSRIYLDNSKRSAIELVKENNNWLKVDCAVAGKLMSRSKISDVVWDNVGNFLK